VILRGILTTYDLLSYDARNSFSGGGECDDRPLHHNLVGEEVKQHSLQPQQHLRMHLDRAARGLGHSMPQLQDLQVQQVQGRQDHLHDENENDEPSFT
jgi:hypothetical protein